MSAISNGTTQFGGQLPTASKALPPATTPNAQPATTPNAQPATTPNAQLVQQVVTTCLDPRLPKQRDNTWYNEYRKRITEEEREEERIEYDQRIDNMVVNAINKSITTRVEDNGRIFPFDEELEADW